MLILKFETSIPLPSSVFESCHGYLLFHTDMMSNTMFVSLTLQVHIQIKRVLKSAYHVRTALEVIQTALSALFVTKVFISEFLSPMSVNY